METFSALLALCAGNSPVTGEFPAQRPVTRSFDVSFDLRLNKRFSKQSRSWWFETASSSLWRHTNAWVSQHDGCKNPGALLVPGRQHGLARLTSPSKPMITQYINYIHAIVLQWRQNGCDGVSNHRCLDCLLNCLFRRRSKRYQSSASLAFVRGIHRWPVDSPHKAPVTRKMLPFDDVIMVGHNRASLESTKSDNHRTYFGPILAQHVMFAVSVQVVKIRTDKKRRQVSYQNCEMSKMIF